MNYFLNHGQSFRIMLRKTGVQSQAESYQSLTWWYLMPLCLTLSIKRYASRVKWINPESEVASFLTHQCSSYWKVSLWVTLDSCPHLFLNFIIFFIILLLSFFLSSVCRWFWTGIFVTIGIFRSPELSSVFSPISYMHW